MTNPNNCATCDHKNVKTTDTRVPDGHCYMFRDEPTEVCMQHTGRRSLMRTVDLLRLSGYLDDIK